MAVQDGETGNAWIEEVKSGGAVSCLDPESCPNAWATSSGDVFMVRGPDYLSDKVKTPGGECLLKPLGFDRRGPAKNGEVLNHPNHRVRKAIDEASIRSEKPFVWVFNLQLLSKDNYGAIAYFVALEPIQDWSLLDQFIKGDDMFRNSRLKLVANIVRGPWIVRTAVGEQAICILGRALSCKYVLGSNYIEVDVDVGSSVVANAIVHLAFGYIPTLTVDLAFFLIESQIQAELPERLIGAVRFSELSPDSAAQYEMPSEENYSNMQSSLPTRLWKSLGQGFSNLLLQGNEDGFISAHGNGTLNVEDSSVARHANGSHQGNEDGFISEHVSGTLNVEDSSVAKHANGSLYHADENEHTSKWHPDSADTAVGNLVNYLSSRSITFL